MEWMNFPIPKKYIVVFFVLYNIAILLAFPSSCLQTDSCLRPLEEPLTLPFSSIGVGGDGDSICIFDEPFTEIWWSH